MPNKEASSKQIHKSRLINNNKVWFPTCFFILPSLKVLISWTEDLDKYKPPAESTYNLNIVIHPLSSKLYQVIPFHKNRPTYPYNRSSSCSAFLNNQRL